MYYNQHYSTSYQHPGYGHYLPPMPPPGVMSFLGISQQGITLKELLENPNLQNPPQLKNVSEGNKEKGNPINDGFDPVTAFLGPNIWNANVCQDSDEFQLEYMDLDEFLSENGVPSCFDDSSNGSQHSQQSLSLSPREETRVQTTLASPRVLEDLVDDLVAVTPSVPSPSASINVPVQVEPASSPDGARQVGQMSPVPPERAGSCSPVRVDVEFEIPDADLALACIPGQEGFDPKKRQFSSEELKPQPIIKKSRKVFVPDDLKDEKYWSRRKKNNVAAKRSRDARRVKENQIALRASFLEKENNKLKDELEKMKKENIKLKSTICAYEKQKQT